MGGGASKATIFPETVTVVPSTSQQGRGQIGPSFMEAMDQYGNKCFTGIVAKKYLLAAGLAPDMVEKVFEDRECLKKFKDVVAKAVLSWAKDNNATMYSHWFQPLGSELYRQGQTGQVRHEAAHCGSEP